MNNKKLNPKRGNIKRPTGSTSNDHHENESYNGSHGLTDHERDLSDQHEPSFGHSGGPVQRPAKTLPRKKNPMQDSHGAAPEHDPFGHPSGNASSEPGFQEEQHAKKPDDGSEVGDNDSSNPFRPPKPKTLPKKAALPEDDVLSEKQTKWNTGMKKGLKTDQDPEHEDVDHIDISHDVEPGGHTTTDTGTKPAKIVVDSFNDAGQSREQRLVNRINALRRGSPDNKKPVLIAADDPELEVVDTNIIASLDQLKKRRKTVMLKDEEQQANIAIALKIKAKWPQYLATGLTVAFVVADIALLILNVQQEFNLINIDSLEIIEGVVDFVKEGFETAEETAQAIKNGKGQSAEVLARRREAGMKALMELTGVERLNSQQTETYDRLRAVLTLEMKKDNLDSDEK